MLIMVEAELVIRKWGDSMAIIIPKDVAKEGKIRVEDKVLVRIIKKTDLSKLFGSVTGLKMSGQELKDMARAGWE